METRSVFWGHHFLEMIIIVSMICLSVGSCQKEDEKTDPVVEDDIVQPKNPTDPAVLPDVKTVIQKYNGDFTPLLTGVVANWRVKSHKKFGDGAFACWSDWVESYFYGKTREGVNGQDVYYPGCAIYSGNTWTPDFSAPCSSVWGQYKKGLEIQDGDVQTTPGGTVNFYRYYTVPDLPDAYILMEKRWEIVPIPNEGDYAYCNGCATFTKSTSTTIGLSIERTREWGYTLGIEYHAGINVAFLEAGAKLTASFNQQFSVSIQNNEETTTTITAAGILPEGKSITRIQVFREIATFKLVNQEGGDYFQGVYSPVIQVTTQTKYYVWYY